MNNQIYLLLKPFEKSVKLKKIYIIDSLCNKNVNENTRSPFVKLIEIAFISNISAKY